MNLQVEWRRRYPISQWGLRLKPADGLAELLADRKLG
jgi:hypothetical protein